MDSVSIRASRIVVQLVVFLLFLGVDRDWGDSIDGWGNTCPGHNRCRCETIKRCPILPHFPYNHQISNGLVVWRNVIMPRKPKAPVAGTDKEKANQRHQDALDLLE